MVERSSDETFSLPIAREVPTEDVLTWIYESDHDFKHGKTRRERVKGSCAWLFERQEYQKWYSDTGTDRVLWCHGKPGAGKTFVTYAIAFKMNKHN
jgi:hypothetical protein